MSKLSDNMLKKISDLMYKTKRNETPEEQLERLKKELPINSGISEHLKMLELPKVPDIVAELASKTRDLNFEMMNHQVAQQRRFAEERRRELEAQETIAQTMKSLEKKINLIDKSGNRKWYATTFLSVVAILVGVVAIVVAKGWM